MILNLILVCLKQKDFLEEEGKPFCHYRQNTGFMPGPVNRNRRVQMIFSKKPNLILLVLRNRSSQRIFSKKETELADYIHQHTGFMSGPVYRYCIQKQACTEGVS